MEPQIYVPCDCEYPWHVIAIRENDIEDEVVLTIQFNLSIPWYKRVWIAFLYILGKGGPQYGLWDEFIYSRESRDLLINAVTRKEIEEQEDLVQKDQSHHECEHQ